MPGIASFWAIRSSNVLASQCCIRYVKRLSSASEARKLMCSMGRKSKLNSAFSVRRLCILLSRNVMLIRDQVVLAETDLLAELSHSLVEYVIDCYLRPTPLKYCNSQA
jgi:hypothetical protein